MSGYIDIDGQQWEHCMICGALIKLEDGERCADHKGMHRDESGQLVYDYAKGA